MTKVFLVDDHRLMRNALKQLIEIEPDLKVCGVATNPDDALKAFAQTKPDIALVDISLGTTQNGIQLVSLIRAQGYTFPILMLSLHEETLYAEKVLKAGAQGYLMKQDAPENIVRAIRNVLGPRKTFFSLSSSQAQ